ncbi:thiamin biosynthesis protein thiC [Vibrio ishigakensis]|uniref:Thiamin biosynthesis protein thiC n=1 Tax=Vibrio ishigakensis TaxID=1481914 RepID=A0A0B8Q298_9VIBR|nr:thiamin biosynthesis protein thiC [Vibrio ishigakensis]
MRQIHQADTLVGGTKDAPIFESNAPLKVYDCAGAYSDLNADIDVRKGLDKLRSNWILEREDTEQLSQASSGFTQQRLADDGLDHLRFEALEPPRRAQKGKRVTQMHYARRGIITPEMEYIALRENMTRTKVTDPVLTQKAPGESLARQ